MENKPLSVFTPLWLGGLFALLLGVLVAVVCLYFEVDERVTFFAGLITTLTISVIILAAFTFSTAQAVGLLERATGRDWDGNGDIGNDGISDEPEEAALVGNVRIKGVSQFTLDKMLGIALRYGSFSESLFIGAGKIFSAGQRITGFVPVRDQLVKRGIVELVGNQYRLSDEGVRAASERVAYYSPTEPAAENAA